MKNQETPKYRPGQRIDIPTKLGLSSVVILRYLGGGEYLVSHRLGVRVVERRMYLH